MAEKRREFSSEEKVRILQRHLVDKVGLSELCDEYGLHPTVFYRWQEMFFKNGATTFERRQDGRTRELETKVPALQANLAQKDEVIAGIMASYVALKESVGES